MVADTPEQAVERVDRAFNQGDLEAVLSFYEPAAVVVTEPSQLARGHEELRRFFTGVLRSGASAHQLTTRVLEADGVALFLSRWIFTPAADPSGAPPNLHRDHGPAPAARWNLEGSN